MSTVYGYARVSTKDQNSDRQIIALCQAGVLKENIFSDKQSGKDFNRKQYKKLMRKLQEGDVIYIKSIDRLGRNYDEIIFQWREITRKKKADICVIDMPILDTRQGKDLMGTFVADLVLQVLSFVAQNERETIRQRQREGIEAAKARGVRFGRPKTPVPEIFADVCHEWRNGLLSGEEAAKKCGMPKSTFFYKAKMIANS